MGFSKVEGSRESIWVEVVGVMGIESRWKEGFVTKFWLDMN